jgi:hypothetical protein
MKKKRRKKFLETVQIWTYISGLSEKEKYECVQVFKNWNLYQMMRLTSKLWQ